MANPAAQENTMTLEQLRARLKEITGANEEITKAQEAAARRARQKQRASADLAAVGETVAGFIIDRGRPVRR